MKKEKLRLKKGVKNILLISTLWIAMVGLVMVYTARVESIQNNPEGYTPEGHAQSVNVQIIK